MNVYHNSFYAMGSRFNAVIPHDNNEVCEKLFYLMQHEVMRVEKKLSYFDKCSEVSRINSEAFKKPVGLDDEMYSILKVCIEFSNITEGAFDITLRPVIENIETKNSSSEFKPGIHNIILKDENRSVFFQNSRVKIDFGAYGKGYALEKIKKIIADSPVKHAFLSFGESSVYVKGNHPAGKKWQVGIKDLFNYEKSLFVFELENESVSSSSNYYTDDAGQVNKKVNIINPFTLLPADDICITSVKASSPAEAEIFSTAFFILNDEKIQEIVSLRPHIEAVKIKMNDSNPVIKHFKRS